MLAAAFCLIACGSDTSAVPPTQQAMPPGDWNPEGDVIPLKLPDGREIEVELRLTYEELSKGMMFRPQLPPDKGMLFVFGERQKRAFWMYQTQVPLDIIWMDDDKRVVEIVDNAPPCTERDFRNCLTYGGNFEAAYVLEVAAGRASALGLDVGDQVSF